MKSSIILGGYLATTGGCAQMLGQVRVGAGLADGIYPDLTITAVIDRYNSTVDELGVGEHIDAGLSIPEVQTACRLLAAAWNAK